MSSHVCELSITNDFTCLADECPDTCCKGVWNIFVDTESIDIWKSHKDKQLVTPLLESIEPFDDDGIKKYRFKMNDNGSCYHMGNTGFCTIHTTGLQPKVCNVYPRLNFDVGFMAVNALELSCPEVVRMVFQSSSTRVLNTSKTLRYWFQQGKDKNGVFSSPEANMQRMVYMLWEKKQYSYQKRLTFLSKLLIYIVDSSAEVPIDKAFFEDIFSSMTGLLKQFSVEVSTSKTLPNSKQSAVIWDSCFSLLKKRVPSLIDPTAPLLGIQDKDELYNHIKLLHRKHKDKLDKFSPLFDRYLEVSFINKMFPSSPYLGNYVASFLNVVIPLFCIKMALYLLLDKKGDITEQDIIDVTYKVERKVQHNLIYNRLSEMPEMLAIDNYYLTFLEL